MATGQRVQLMTTLANRMEFAVAEMAAVLSRGDSTAAPNQGSSSFEDDLERALSVIRSFQQMAMLGQHQWLRAPTDTASTSTPQSPGAGVPSNPPAAPRASPEEQELDEQLSLKIAELNALEAEIQAYQSERPASSTSTDQAAVPAAPAHQLLQQGQSIMSMISTLQCDLRQLFERQLLDAAAAAATVVSTSDTGSSGQPLSSEGAGSGDALRGCATYLQRLVHSNHRDPLANSDASTTAAVLNWLDQAMANTPYTVDVIARYVTASSFIREAFLARDGIPKLIHDIMKYEGYMASTLSAIDAIVVGAEAGWVDVFIRYGTRGFRLPFPFSIGSSALTTIVAPGRKVHSSWLQQ